MRPSGRRRRPSPRGSGSPCGSFASISSASWGATPWSIPIWFSSIGAVVWLLKGPFGEALLRSIADRDRDPDALGTDPGVLQELDDLRAQVSELQERMDFTERLLARERETRPLGAGDHA